MKMYPSEIVRQLRREAARGENLTMLPKEHTLEWQAADLIKSHKREIDNYEKLYYGVVKTLEDFHNPDVRLRTSRPFRVKLRKKS
jgi:hypothetical protein